MKNFFNGVLNGLKNSYKNVTQEASDYDDENNSQLVRYNFKYNKNSYELDVMYYDEKGVIVMEIMDEDKPGIEKDDFSITTIDKAIEHVLNFVEWNLK